MDDYDDPMATVAPQVPSTAKHKIRTDLETFIPKPYLARALVCPSIEHPTGNPTGQIKHQDMTVLQQHVSFFDRNDDGIVYPWETYQGLRAIGFNSILAIAMTVVVHILMSYCTSPGWIPSFLFPIYVQNVHKAKHGSDSGTYDTEGRFVPANFETMFSKYARTSPDKFTAIEIWNMTQGNRNAYDIMGGVAIKLEWALLYFLAKDEDGFVTKEIVRSCFDGSLFYQLQSKQHGHKQ
ncbi:Peroxygenase [Thalictrum thalictroides]|uniref:Peroxygenase n=1 Tax=Thalictrum thalictroides TaxID=46969 RepID=A0A7J6VVU0_THATH|nr:Peroxygenase [Thalictrum thalictroides]